MSERRSGSEWRRRRRCRRLGGCSGKRGVGGGARGGACAQVRLDHRKGRALAAVFSGLAALEGDRWLSLGGARGRALRSRTPEEATAPIRLSTRLLAVSSVERSGTVGDSAPPALVRRQEAAKADPRPRRERRLDPDGGRERSATVVPRPRRGRQLRRGRLRVGKDGVGRSSLTETSTRLAAKARAHRRGGAGRGASSSTGSPSRCGTALGKVNGSDLGQRLWPSTQLLERGGTGQG
ncbi:vegetative cell wall protein gp1-like [Iris pallida]|uniref:Vegetative cell wall protein gp1-like n=1 Tax=Iris pallida TaxID=29817 RepID=A0AAX6GLX8_IRIPA|nr:vegetative cell wall protein gp1-like [Iris pallida]